MELQAEHLQDDQKEPMDEFDLLYDARMRQEVEERRRYREELLMHRNNIRICNRMLVLEGIVLASLVVALILQVAWN